jgi:hypothetical protein
MPDLDSSSTTPRAKTDNSTQIRITPRSRTVRPMVPLLFLPRPPLPSGPHSEVQDFARPHPGPQGFALSAPGFSLAHLDTPPATTHQRAVAHQTAARPIEHPPSGRCSEQQLTRRYPGLLSTHREDTAAINGSSHGSIAPAGSTSKPGSARLQDASQVPPNLLAKCQRATMTTSGPRPFTSPKGDSYRDL